MKAEEIYMSVQDEECPNLNNLTLPDEWQLKAMKAYAMQECEKVRRQCENNAYSALDDFNVLNMVVVYVCKEIQSTPIELT